jgi:Flp pilus assembly protein TadG
MRKFKKNAVREERGQAMVEFILAVSFVFVLLLWAMELTSLVYTYTVMADAAKEGVRYAVVHGSNTDTTHCSGPYPPSIPASCTDSTGALVQTVVTNVAKASFHDVSAMTVNVTYLDGNNQTPNRVQVTVSYPYKAMFGSLGWSPPTINAASEGRIVN